MSDLKDQPVASFQEFDGPPSSNSPASGTTRLVEATRLGLTVLGFVGSVIIVGTAADTLAVYNNTSLSQDFWLPLWPSNFSLQPTIALVTCGCIMLVASALSLAMSKIPALHQKTSILRIVNFTSPIIALIASIIATALCYSINDSSRTFSLQAWSCQWSALDMSVDPHFGILCKESRAALYLTVMMIPLQCLVLVMAGVDLLAEKKRNVGHFDQERKDASRSVSPSMT
ncbi:hypothetical protein PVAG01_09645 [Phlyctema vagabunda]|uniref:Uncharacterized protein n=1 Tax=Phlyctema vagabunda TaxID=108571 RepID=A0ABR4P7Y8_9HELO